MLVDLHLQVSPVRKQRKDSFHFLVGNMENAPVGPGEALLLPGVDGKRDHGHEFPGSTANLDSIILIRILEEHKEILSRCWTSLDFTSRTNVHSIGPQAKSSGV